MNYKYDKYESKEFLFKYIIHEDLKHGWSINKSILMEPIVPRLVFNSYPRCFLPRKICDKNDNYEFIASLLLTNSCLPHYYYD